MDDGLVTDVDRARDAIARGPMSDEVRRATLHGVPFPGDDASGNDGISKRLSFAY